MAPDSCWKKAEYLLIAGKIVSVEARHATALRYLIGMKGSANANAGNATATRVRLESPKRMQTTVS